MGFEIGSRITAVSEKFNKTINGELVRILPANVSITHREAETYFKILIEDIKFEQKYKTISTAKVPRLVLNQNDDGNYSIVPVSRSWRFYRNKQS